MFFINKWDDILNHQTNLLKQKFTIFRFNLIAQLLNANPATQLLHLRKRHRFR